MKFNSAREQLATPERSYHNAIQYSRGMDFYKANGQGNDFLAELDDTESILTFSISNANTASAETAYIFAAAKGLTSAGSNITVTLEESSHNQLRESLKSNPIRIVGMRYIAETVAQLSKKIYIYDEGATGELSRKSVTPTTYRSPLNNISTQVDALNLKIDVGVDTYLTHELAASEDITIIFKIVEKGNALGAITGQPGKKVSRNLLTTGLPYDIMSNIKAAR